MKNRTTIALALSVSAALGVAASAHATTFADYSAASSDPNVAWTQSANLTSGTLATSGMSGSADTVFSFLSAPLSALSDLQALFTLNASGSANDPAIIAGTQVTEPDLSGSFSFIYEGAAPLHVGTNTYMTGANLLSGTFSGADIVGTLGGSTGSVQDAVMSGGTVNFTSDFTSFSPIGDKGVSVEMTSVLPSLNALLGDSLSSFSAVSTGSFAATLVGGGGGGGVPEPATWAMMFLGFGGIGVLARRARRLARRSLV
jgi:hypothetical protein